MALYGDEVLPKPCWSRGFSQKGPTEAGTPADTDRQCQCYAVLNHVEKADLHRLNSQP
jgi:hypothetical protein